MLPNMPYKKMEKVNRFGFIAKCDCGYIHKFKSNEMNLQTVNGSSIEFINIFKCPSCGQSYDGIFENIKNKKYSVLGIFITSVLIFGILFGGFHLLSNLFSPPPLTDYNNATNKQIQDFNKWQQKQDQQKWENAPAFPNNK